MSSRCAPALHYKVSGIGRFRLPTTLSSFAETLPASLLDANRVLWCFRGRKPTDVFSWPARSAGFWRPGRGRRGGGGDRGGDYAGADRARGAGGGGLRVRCVAGPVPGGVARAGNRLDPHHRVSHGRVRGDERGSSGVVPALFAGAFVRPRAGGGVSPTGRRGGGRGSRVRALRRVAAAGGTVPGHHGNRRERGPRVHRPPRVRFWRAPGWAGGGTHGAVLSAGAAGVGVRQWRAQERGGEGGAGRARRGSVSGVGAAAARFGDFVSGCGGGFDVVKKGRHAPTNG